MALSQVLGVRKTDVWMETTARMAKAAGCSWLDPGRGQIPSQDSIREFGL